MTLKPTGASLNIWVDGVFSGNDCVTLQCDHNTETQWRCPFSIGYVMPMEEGARCFAKDGCDCHKSSAKLAVLERALALVKREIRKVKEEMGDA